MSDKDQTNEKWSRRNFIQTAAMTAAALAIPGVRKEKPVLTTLVGDFDPLRSYPYRGWEDFYRNLATDVVSDNTKLQTRTIVVDGLVAAVDGGQIVLNVGAKNGLKVGDQLSVERVTREIKDPSTGAVIRRLSTPIGVIQVTDVDDISAVAKTLAVMSDRQPPLFAYFKQLFAQVTNPPIDPIRESVVMSLQAGVGAEVNLLVENPEQAHQLVMDQPILRNHELEKLRQVSHEIFDAATLDITWPIEQGHEGMDAPARRRCARRPPATSTTAPTS